MHVSKLRKTKLRLMTFYPLSGRLWVISVLKEFANYFYISAVNPFKSNK